MRLYGVILGFLLLFYLLGLFLGSNQWVEVRPKEVSLPMAETPLEDIEPGLEFFKTLMEPPVTESHSPSSERELVAGPERPGESPTDANQSATPLNDVYTVQVGAFSDEAEALQTFNRLEVRGYPSVLRTPSHSDLLYGVSVGEFATNQEVLEMEEKLRKDGFSTYIKRIQISSATH
jgi:cell division protein FtsN